MNINQNQTKQFYYIDRKLISNNYLQVVQALGQLQKYIQNLKVQQILNSLIMRVIDIFASSRISYLRIKASKILMKFGHKFPSLPSKQQIISHMVKCVKSKEQLVRILALQTVQKIALLFQRQNSLYHILLDKLRSTNNTIQLKQKIKTINCICAILSRSQYLSKLFSRNINQLLNIGNIDITIILYISNDAAYEVQQLPNIVMQLWRICKCKKVSKKIIYYMSKLIYNSSIKNYKVIYVYYKYIQQDIPSLSQKLQYIKLTYYPFISELQSNAILYNVTNQQLLDICYRTPYTQSSFAQLSLMCWNRIQKHIQMQQVDKYVHLLSYYCTSSQVDRVLASYKHTHTHTPSLMLLLKVSMVCGNYQCANTIVSQLLNTFHRSFKPLIIIKSYLDYMLSPQQQDKFNMMCQIIRNVALKDKQHRLLQLVQLWKNNKNNNSQGDIINKNQLQLQDCKIKCEQQISALKYRKQRRVPLRLHNKDNGMYLGKKTVIDILDKL